MAKVMKFQIRQNKLQEEAKKKIFEGFGKQAIETTGINGLDEESISFEIFKEQEFIGAIVVQVFWGQLHIKNLFIEKHYRGQGIARKLLNYAFEFGKQRGCHFAFVETMSFQAPEFYQKMGFEIEFSRSGYTVNSSFHYLKKNLNSDLNGAVVK
jgi:ribosomal protein S18 acetylase RimI-like enzyme